MHPAPEPEESNVEKMFGPYDGFFVAVYVRDLGNLGTSFLGQYKICRTAPYDYFGADFVRSKCVEGISGGMEEAMEIALQLARLQIKTLRQHLKESSRSRNQAEPVRLSPPAVYAPTMPCPL